MIKFGKKFISILLSLILVFSCAAVSFAADEKTPILIIPGFGQSETRVYDDNGDFMGEINSFNLPNLDAKALILDLVLPLFKSIVSRKDMTLSDAATAEINKVFKPYLKNDDGSYKYTTVLREFNHSFAASSEADRAELNHHIRMNGFDQFDAVRYYFTYDSFASIKTAADRLHDYLHNVVMAQTGADKVTFVPVSQGGTVFQMFLELYPEDAQYIKKVISMIPAYDGSIIVGDVLTDNVRIYDQNYLHETVLPSLLGETDAAYAVSIALRLGLTGDTLVKVEKAALSAAIDALITRSSMMWALCPAAQYGEAVDKLLADESLADVKAEVLKYAEARANFPAHIAELMDSGVIVHNIISYDVGMMLASLFGSNDLDADELLAPSSPSLGATAAKLGETLGDDYIAAGTFCTNPEHNHVSPDKKIDASTSFLPENTWYFKGVGHTTMNGREDIKRFAVELILNDNITDVHSVGASYSQFTDPVDYIASTVQNNGYNYYYDVDGNYMYSEKTPEESVEQENAKPQVNGFIRIFAALLTLISKVLGYLGIKIQGLF